MRTRREWLGLTISILGSLSCGCGLKDKSDFRLSRDPESDGKGSESISPERKRVAEPPSETANEARRRLDFEREKLAFERERLEVERKRVQEDAQRQKDQTTFLLAVIGGVVAVVGAVVGIALKVSRREKT